MHPPAHSEQLPPSPPPTGLLYDPVFLEHQTAPGHPERSERLQVSWQALQRQPWFFELRQLAPRLVEEEWLHTVHDAQYISRAERQCGIGAPYLDVPDVSVCPDSYQVARQAAGGCLVLADALVSGQIRNGFALLRPPGHHAEADLALGFCLFNNAAILTRYLQKRHGLNKILILDWDVHHGNGTQHIFEADPSVLYISLHQYPYYPGTGGWNETGTGRGHGATCNCPMQAGCGDAAYQQAFRERVLPYIDAFRPECIIISAGFDAHHADPLGGIQLSTECYGWMSERLLEKAELYANGRLLSLLEGGYHLQALSSCITLHLAHLSRQSPPPAGHYHGILPVA